MSFFQFRSLLVCSAFAVLSLGAVLLDLITGYHRIDESTRWRCLALGSISAVSAVVSWNRLKGDSGGRRRRSVEAAFEAEPEELSQPAAIIPRTRPVRSEAPRPEVEPVATETTPAKLVPRVAPRSRDRRVS
jgi:hypothetical protein